MAVNLPCVSCECNFWDAAGYNEHQIVDYLVAHRVLKTETDCPKCGSIVKLDKDLLQFRCNKSVSVNKQKKSQCKWKASAKTGTFLDNTRIDLGKLWRIILYLLHHNPPRQNFLQKTLNLGPNTVVDWFSFYREVLSFHNKQNQEQLGGPGCIVEIDEAKFGKRKYNRGRLVKGQWVLGGVVRVTGESFFIPVPDRTRKTLTKLVRKYVRPGSIIITDCWRAYYTLRSRFKYLTVNHSKNFVDPDSGAHTNNIERRWRDIRAAIPKYGRSEKHFLGYLAEYQFKERYAFRFHPHVFFTAAGKLYPPTH